MLDIYAVDDTDRTPEDPPIEKWVGSLELKEYALLDEYWEDLRRAEVDVSFFADSRVSSPGVCQMHDIFIKFEQQNEGLSRGKPCKVMRAVLENATKRGVGLAFFCD